MANRCRRLAPEVRREAIRLAAMGMSQRAIAEQIAIGSTTVSAILKPYGGVIRKEMWEPPSGKHLSLDERIEIKLGLDKGLSYREIARRLERDPATVSREVNRNGGRDNYWPSKAHKLAEQRARRPKTTKLAANSQLCDRVVADLQRLWSPRQISVRLREEFPNDPSMQISHESIYKSLYVQGRGELRRELASCLRSGRAQRVRRGRLETRGTIPGMVMISERPAEAADRAVPGHWEGDLLLGRNGKSAIGTLVERATRYVMLFPLPKGRTAEQVRAAMTETVQQLPVSLRRSLTWDQGKEMAEHARFSIDTGVDVYFCDPHSPWQRGSNENTNGLLRQYFPKGKSLARCTQEELDAVADSLNGRPRETLGWRTPAEKLDEFLLR